ncbi:MAG: hypothetical protein GF308_21145 [Candidatus Heimdallarchaeota archaeon]|nr:hypothetical protein [Candidatus Heimdallarchaeota archaeon]
MSIIKTKNELIKDKSLENEKTKEEYTKVELQKAILTEKDNIEAWKQLGELYFKEENYSRALSCYFQLTSLSPKDPSNWNKLAVTFLQMDEPKLASKIAKIAFHLALQQEG